MTTWGCRPAKSSLSEATPHFVLTKPGEAGVLAPLTGEASEA